MYFVATWYETVACTTVCLSCVCEITSGVTSFLSVHKILSVEQGDVPVKAPVLLLLLIFEVSRLS